MGKSRVSKSIVALALVLLLPLAVSRAQQPDPQSRAQALIDKGLDFLKTQQKSDGGWQTEKDPPAITAIVLRAFVRHDNYDANTDFVKRGYDKLLSYQLESGGIYKDLLANYNTAIAVSALAAAENPAFKPQIEKATQYLKGLQWTDMTTSAEGEKIAGETDAWYGGWGDGGRSRRRGRAGLRDVPV